MPDQTTSKEPLDLGTAFKGDYRLAWTQGVFLHHFIESIKTNAPSVLQSMQADIQLTTAERVLSPSICIDAVDALCVDGIDRPAPAPGSKWDRGLRLVRDKLWPWALSHGLVQSIESLRDDESRIDELNLKLKYHYEMIRSIFEAVRHWAKNPSQPKASDAWVVTRQESVMPLIEFARISDGEEMSFLQEGDSPPSLVTESADPKVNYRLNIIIEGWDPLNETKVAARERILKEVSTLLKRKLDAVDTLMRNSQDALVSPVFTNPDHFVWLVRFQILKLPYAKVIKLGEPKKSPQAKYNGIDSAARYLVGENYKSWLRVSPRGPTHD